jgi:hypothetical protein
MINYKSINHDNNTNINDINEKTNKQHFNDFQQWFNHEHQRLEQERIFQQECKYQNSIIRPQLKKLLKEGAPFAGDLQDVFPMHYKKTFGSSIENKR